MLFRSERDHDVFGDTVNVAARVTALARPAQILAPKPCVEALPGYMQSGIRTLGAFGVRGKEQPLDLCEILWDISADLTVMHGGPTHSTPSAAALMIAYRGQNWQVARDGHVTLGRAVDNDVVVDCPRASRTHARIEGRPAGFVLIDLSSNGTFVANTTGREIILRREELLLQGEGSIGPGERPGVDPQGALRFSFSN